MRHGDKVRTTHHLTAADLGLAERARVIIPKGLQGVVTWLPFNRGARVLEVTFPALPSARRVYFIRADSLELIQGDRQRVG